MQQCDGGCGGQLPGECFLFAGGFRTSQRNFNGDDDAPNSPQVLNVVANGTAAFAVASAASALTTSVKAGQTAMYSLQLTPGADFNGMISFACAGAPLAAKCQVPTGVTLNIGAPATLTVTVTTSGQGAAPPESGQRRVPSDPWLRTIPALGLAIAWVGWIAWLRRKARGKGLAGIAIAGIQRKGLAVGMMGLLLVLPAMGVLEGCGGGASSPAPQGSSVVTPRGTSVLVLTPSGNSLSGRPLQFSPIQLTLVVN